MDKNLVGYLLNALDDEESARVEASLRDDAEAKARLEAMRQTLAPLAADADAPAPPADLGLRTLARIAEQSCSRLPPAPRPRLYQGEASPRRWFRRPDLIAAAAIFIVVGGLFVPALLRQWDSYHRQACTNNLKLFGESLQAYSDSRDGMFPQVRPVDGPRGVAGVFVPMLLEAGVLDPSAVSVSCPAEGIRRPAERTVADLESLYRSRPADFDAVARDLAPGYAYALGYQEGDRLFGPRRDLGDQAPILADRPGEAGSLDNNSPNHGGKGQNVLHVGGHVRWCTTRTVGADLDDIYLNQDLQVLAGLQRSDTVLGPSWSCPVRRNRD